MNLAAHLVLVFMCPCAGVSAQVSDGTLTVGQEAFVASAEKFEYLGLWPTRGRSLIEPEADELVRFNTILSGEEIQPLLKHDNARVRAAAIVALRLRGEARWLPSIAELALDTAEAPQRRSGISMPILLGSIGTPSGPAYNSEPQTVASLANGTIGLYLRNRGECFLHGDRGHRPKFREYWESHAGLDACLCWNMSALHIASRGCSPMREDRKPAIQQLRRRIDSIESPLREWILLGLGTPYLNGESLSGAKELVSELELLQAAKKIGELKVMEFLRGNEAVALGAHYPSFHRTALTSERMAGYFLNHATELIPKADPAELVALDGMHTGRARVGSSPIGANPMYAIAAANLAPQKATWILIDCLERHANLGYRSFSESSIAYALWTHGGVGQLDRIQDWFYGLNESSNQGQYQATFLRLLEGVEHKHLLRALLQDARLSTVTGTTLNSLGRSLWQMTGEWVVPQSELRMGGQMLCDADHAMAFSQFAKGW